MSAVSEQRQLEKYQLSDIATPTPIVSHEQLADYTAALIEIERRWQVLSDHEKAFANVLAIFIEKYEREYFSIPKASPIEVLIGLMEENNLKQKDLAALLGGESVVSEVLNGRRELNKRQIAKLSERFSVSPAAFFAA